MKSKADVVMEEPSPSVQKLTKEISILMTIVKSAAMGSAKPMNTGDKNKGPSGKNP